MELLIKNAEIYDGEQETGRRGCVLIKGDRIEAVMEQPPEGYEGETLDAEGLCLAPGFIDSHSHNDFYAVLDDAHKYNQSFVRQGITSMVAGNCGFSAMGYGDTAHYADIPAFFAHNPDYRDCADFAGWAEVISKKSPLNMACLAGHGALRAAVRGLGGGALSEEEWQRMEKLLSGALEQGAAGISFGLMYDPGMFAPGEELLRVAEIAKRHDRPVTFHQRALSKVSMSYPDLLGRAHNLRAMDEMIEIAEKSGAKTHISHIIFVGQSSWRTMDEALRMIDDANARGLDITFDIYPFDFGASTINVVMPSWYQGMTKTQKKKAKARLYVEIIASLKLLGVSFNDIEITYAGEDHPEYIGKRVKQIAKELGMGDIAAYLKIIEDAEGGPDPTIHMYKYMNDHIIDTLSRHEAVMYMTDAWIIERGAQNFAAYGAFPKFLRLSREGRAESLGKMLRKMTGAPAARFGLRDRGVIRPGAYADIVLFDKGAVRETDCETPPVGIPHVLINGEFQVKDGEYQEKALGRGLAYA